MLSRSDFPSPFPVGPITYAGIYIGQQDLGVLAVVLVMLAIVFVFFRFTKIGLAMRAAALYPESSQLGGVRVRWILAPGWGLGAGGGCAAGERPGWVRTLPSARDRGVSRGACRRPGSRVRIFAPRWTRSSADTRLLHVHRRIPPLPGTA